MPGIKKADIGKRVTVAGYDDCKGTIRFVGMHATERTKRVGVELDKPVGKNNGTVKGKAIHTSSSYPSSYVQVTINS